MMKGKNLKNFLGTIVISNNAVVVTVLTASLAFSVFTNTMVSNDSVIKENDPKWDIHFNNVVPDSRNNVVATNPVKILDDTTKLGFSVPLELPGDRYGFDVEIVNAGNIDAMINTISIYGLDSELSKYISYSVIYSDESLIKEKDLLSAGETKKVHIEIIYDDKTKENLNITKELAMSLIVDFDYVQADITAVKR